VNRFREIEDSTDDRRILDGFYDDLYVAEFPDRNERESLDNIRRYLGLKSRGWYGKNNYHVIVAHGEKGATAGSISDFLAEPNAGVIEFLVVGRASRGSGAGKRLLDRTEKQLVDDAARTLGRELDCIVAEMNDPFRPSQTADNLDPFLRATIWDKWGYRRLDFPYVQPALSRNQSPVPNLMLIIKVLGPNSERSVPAQNVKLIIHEYMRWAMRIDDPETSPVFRKMSEHLDRIAEVPTPPLGAYVGRDPARPLAIRDLADAADRDLDGVLDVYKTAFPGGPTDIDPAALRQALSFRGRRPGNYHLWAIRTAAQSAIEGVASFFTFARAGFGGYIALVGSLRGSGRFPLLLARIEEQMIRDRTGASGWFIECDPRQEALFRRFGFVCVDCIYRQPPLRSSSPYEPGDAPPLLLMYKSFGRNYDPPVVGRDDFLSMLGDIYRAVYDIEPKQSRFYADLCAQTTHWRDGKVRFC